VRYRVTEGTERDSVRRPRRSFPPSSLGDVTFDYAPRTTGNEAAAITVYTKMALVAAEKLIIPIFNTDYGCTASLIIPCQKNLWLLGETFQ